MKKMSKLVAWTLVLAMLQALIPAFGVTALIGESTGTFDLSSGTWTSGSGAACNWDGTVLAVGDGADIIITGASTGQRRIEVEADAKNVHITLDNVMLTDLYYGQCALLLNEGAEVALFLANGTASLLVGGDSCAGIQVPGSAVLSIDGPGSLVSIGGAGSSGIGAGFAGDCGTITINSGSVTAVGGEEMPLAPEDISSMSITVSVVKVADNYRSDLFKLDWITNRDAGSFLAQWSGGGVGQADFITFDNQPSQSGTYGYDAVFTPPHSFATDFLYFRVVQIDGDEIAESNLVKMAYMEGIGFVPELEEDNNGNDRPIIEFDMGDYYITKKLTCDVYRNSQKEVEQVATISMSIKKRYEIGFDNFVSLKGIMFDLYTDPPIMINSHLGGMYGFELAVEPGSNFNFPAEGVRLEYTYNVPDMQPDVWRYELSKIIKETDYYEYPEPIYELDPSSLQYVKREGIVEYTHDSRYPLASLGYPAEFIDASFDPDTQTFSATLPGPGRYHMMYYRTWQSGDPPPEPPLPINPPPPEEIYTPPVFTGWQPTSKLAQIIYEAGFEYDPESNLLYARMNANQRDLGYAYFYDEGIPLISSNITCEPIYFIYNNKEWLIEIWKGQYGIELGAEIGVYNRPLNGDLVKNRIQTNYKALVNEFVKQTESYTGISIPGQILDVLNTVTNNITPAQFEGIIQKAFDVAKETAKLPDPAGIFSRARDAVGVLLFGLRSKLYDCVPDNERLLMSYTLMNGSKPLFSRGPTDHWWLTGFDWGNYTNSPNHLTMDSTIWFPTQEMRDASLSGYNNTTEAAPFLNKDASYYESYAFYNNDNNLRMKRGLIGMGYQKFDDWLNFINMLGFDKVNNIDDYLSNSTIELTIRLFGYRTNFYEVLPYQSGSGYGVRFLHTNPIAKQPFITTQAAKFVNANNMNTVVMYNTLKDIVGCKSNDPNELEERVLRYSGSQRNYVNILYGFITNEITRVTDSAFDIAKAAMSPKPASRVSPAGASVDMMQFFSEVTTEGASPDDFLFDFDIEKPGLGGDGGIIFINGGEVTVFGGIAGDVKALPSAYIYWTNTNPEEPSPFGDGITVPTGAVFVNAYEYTYVKIAAISEEVAKADYAELDAALAAIAELDEDDYTAESWAILVAAAEAAENIDRNLTQYDQDIVDAAVYAITEAMLALDLTVILKPEVVDMKTNIHSVINVTEITKGVWQVTINVTKIFNNGDTVSDAIEVIVPKNGSGKIDLGDYILVYDIKGNGSNVKVLEIVKK
jgi:hypothetical protein